MQDCPAEGVATVAVFTSSAALERTNAWLNAPICYFSAGNDWPDTLPMIVEIEGGLCRIGLVLFHFMTMEDARSCLHALDSGQ